MVELLPAILAKGSEVTIVSSSISAADEAELNDIRRQTKLPITVKRGDPSSPLVLESLPLEKMDCVILLQSAASKAGGEGSTSAGGDVAVAGAAEDSSQATVTALLIRSIQSARGRLQEASIVAEVPSSERDVAQAVERLALDGVVCPIHMEANVLAQITHDPDVGTVLDEIIASERNRVVVRQADEFVGEGERLTFWELQSRVRVTEELLIAYRHGGEWQINPPDKHEPIEWNPEDRLLLISASSVAQVT